MNEQRTERIDTRDFGAPEALLLVARSIATAVSDRVQVQGLTKGEGDEVGQEMATAIIGQLKHDVDGRLPHRRQVAIYYAVAGGHTHLTIFTGGSYGSRGRAGDIVVRNEEWQTIAFALRLVEVMLPGVFELHDASVDVMEEPESVPLSLQLVEEDYRALDTIVENAATITTTEEAGLAMLRWGTGRYQKASADLEAGVAELEDFMNKGE